LFGNDFLQLTCFTAQDVHLASRSSTGRIAHPEWSPNFDHDRAQSTATRKAFLEAHCETDTLVLTSHFPAPSVGRLVRHPERPFDLSYLPSS
jgi:hypothetical protein